MADLVVGEAARPGLGGAGPGGRSPWSTGRAAPPEQTDADIDRMFTRAMAWRECPVSRDRMVQINQMTLAYFRSHFRDRGDRPTSPTGSART